MKLHQRIASRLRFDRYREERAGSLWKRDGDQPPGREGAGRHRSLGTLYRELVTMVRGHWGTIGLALGFFHYGEVLFWHKQVVFWATVLIVMYFMFNEPKKPG